VGFDACVCGAVSVLLMYEVRVVVFVASSISSFFLLYSFFVRALYYILLAADLIVVAAGVRNGQKPLLHNKFLT
jgi:hypothetical protein